MAKLNYFILFTLTMLVVLLIIAADADAGAGAGAGAGVVDEGSHGTDKNGIKEKWTFTASTTSTLGFRFLEATKCHEIPCDTPDHPAEICDPIDDCGRCKVKESRCYYPDEEEEEEEEQH